VHNSGPSFVKVTRHKLVGESVGDLLESPEHTTSIEIEAEKKIACQDGVDVVEHNTLLVAVVEPYLLYYIFSTAKAKGVRTAQKNDFDRFG